MTATDAEKPAPGDHVEDAINRGRSAEDAAEGSDDLPGEDDGSPHAPPAVKLAE